LMRIGMKLFQIRLFLGFKLFGTSLTTAWRILVP
jgi:hypothetical protein